MNGQSVYLIRKITDSLLQKMPKNSNISQTNYLNSVDTEQYSGIFGNRADFE